MSLRQRENGGWQATLERIPVRRRAVLGTPWGSCTSSDLRIEGLGLEAVFAGQGRGIGLRPTGRILGKFTLILGSLGTGGRLNDDDKLRLGAIISAA